MGERNPNRLEVIYFEICRASRNEGLTLKEVFGEKPLPELLSEIPSDEEFKAKLESIEINSVTPAWREILVQINRGLGTGETRIESPNRVHVEHILPQNPRATALTEADISREEATALKRLS